MNALPQSQYLRCSQILQGIGSVWHRDQGEAIIRDMVSGQLLPAKGIAQLTALVCSSEESQESSYLPTLPATVWVS